VLRRDELAELNAKLDGVSKDVDRLLLEVGRFATALLGLVHAQQHLGTAISGIIQQQTQTNLWLEWMAIRSGTVEVTFH